MARVVDINRSLRKGRAVPLKLFSVDLFDTLLLRGLVPEPQRFRDIAEHWARLPSCREHDLSADAIFEARWQCAKVAYRVAKPRCGVREATLPDILSLQLLALGLPVDNLPHVLEIELAYEELALRPNLAVAELCRTARDCGYRVVVASDMYLHTKDIVRLLSHHNLAELVDAIFVSAALGATKSSGQLFRHMLHTEAVDPISVLHVGDNPNSDYRMPCSLGIEAHWLPRPLPWRFTARVLDIAFRWRHPYLRLL